MIPSPSWVSVTVMPANWGYVRMKLGVPVRKAGVGGRTCVGWEASKAATKDWSHQLLMPKNGGDARLPRHNTTNKKCMGCATKKIGRRVQV